MRRLLGPAVLMALTMAVSEPAAAQQAGPDDGAGVEGAAWNVDQAHSEVTFSVRHFFTPVTGRFGEFDIQLAFDPTNPEASSVSATIPVASIDTGNDRRDDHLRSGDFFAADENPEITFASTSVRAAEEDRLVATGNLTIGGVTREVELPIQILGIMEVPPPMQESMGIEEVASFEATLTIDRRDFGVGTGTWAETAVVGADVEIAIRVEANR